MTRAGAADSIPAPRGLSFLRVAVTNDDIPQLYFYQRHGFAIYEVGVGEMRCGRGMGASQQIRPGAMTF